MTAARETVVDPSTSGTLPPGAGGVLTRVLGGRRVLLADRSETLREALEGASCAVRVSGVGDVSRLLADSRGWRPEALVLGEDLARVPEPAATLAAIAREACGTRLVLAFRNRASAAALVGALVEGRDVDGLLPRQVEAWVSAAGLEVVAREGVPAESSATLAPDASVRIHSLIQALAPDAAHAWVAWDLAPAEHGVLVPGLLSVVIRTHDPGRLTLLDHAVFSLACQRYRPLEIVVAVQPHDAEHVGAVAAVLERHAELGRYAHRTAIVPGVGDQRGRATNVGIRFARGQYLAFLDDDDVVYPGHYATLVDAIRSGPHAWAVSRIRLARFSRTTDGDLFCTEKSLFAAPDRFEMTRLVATNYIPNHAYVVDRSRVGPFQLSFSERVMRNEDYELLLRLASAFRPAYIPNATAEYRIRDDGSNVNPIDPALAQGDERERWRSADEAQAQMKARWPVLMTMAELRAETEHITPLLLPAHPLRYRLADRANLLLKRVVPGWHPRLKRWIHRIVARV